MRRDRALYPVDQLHALIRHSQAHHRRETIAFGRRVNAVLERRLFPHRVGLPGSWEKIYRRDLVTPSVGRNHRHRLIQAY
jgi:hypothetical protein